MNLLVYASDIAACIGKNRFKRVQDMVRKYKHGDTTTILDSTFVPKSVLKKVQSVETVQQANAMDIQLLEPEIVNRVNETLDIEERRSILQESACLSDTEIEEIANHRIKVHNESRTLIVKELESAVARNVGTCTEKSVTEKISDQLGIDIYDSNAKCFYHAIEKGFRICGRVDGLFEYENRECILEVKTRRYRFLGVPDYERIQAEAYMRLVGRDCILLVEQAPSGELEMHWMERDDKLWKRIETGLKGFRALIEK